MKLSDFKIKITDNPWNDMDEEAGKEFHDRREKQVKTWRDVVHKSIDLGDSKPEDTPKIPDDHYERGKLDDKAKEDVYCDSCGTALDDGGKCFMCSKDSSEEKEEK